MPAPMSSQLETTSAILGEYMLKGWTLTDLHCDQCNITPLMREPENQAEKEGRMERIQFCALCDGRPAPPAAAGPSPSSALSSGQGQGQRGGGVPTSVVPTSTFTSASASTSNSLPSSSIIPNSSFVRRRLAPSQAPNTRDPSEKISDLLLKGYSLLNSNCPHPSCPGIPLVGWPRRIDGTKDPKRGCVNCNSVWEGGELVYDGREGQDQSARDDEKGAGVGVGEVGDGMEDHLERRRRELYGLTSTSNSGPFSSAPAPYSGLEKSLPTVTNLGQDSTVSGETKDLPDLPSSSSAITAPAKPSSSPSPSLSAALDQTSSSLSVTLSRLATSLERHSSTLGTGTHRNGFGAGAGIVERERERDEGRWFVDLKLHTEAIKDVMVVLGEVEKFQRRI